MKMTVSTSWQNDIAVIILSLHLQNLCTCMRMYICMFCMYVHTFVCMYVRMYVPYFLD